MITLSLEEKVMLHKYKVLSFAIVAALYIFLVPSTSHAQRHVPNTFAGDKACGGAAWTLGCDRIALNGQPGTARVCERLARTAYMIIQATGGYCYYYKEGKSSGRGGPNMWSYVNDRHEDRYMYNSVAAEAARRQHEFESIDRRLPTCAVAGCRGRGMNKFEHTDINP